MSVRRQQSKIEIRRWVHKKNPAIIAAFNKIYT
jgi:hypothetical protein